MYMIQQHIPINPDLPDFQSMLNDFKKMNKDTLSKLNPKIPKLISAFESKYKDTDHLSSITCLLDICNLPLLEEEIEHLHLSRSTSYSKLKTKNDKFYKNMDLDDMLLHHSSKALFSFSTFKTLIFDEDNNRVDRASFELLKLLNGYSRGLGSLNLTIRLGALALMFLILELVRLSPTPDICWLRYAIQEVKKYTKWPQPYCSMADNVMRVLIKECHAPGDYLRYKLFQERPSLISEATSDLAKSNLYMGNENVDNNTDDNDDEKEDGSSQCKSLIDIYYDDDCIQASNIKNLMSNIDFNDEGENTENKNVETLNDRLRRQILTNIMEQDFDIEGLGVDPDIDPLNLTPVPDKVKDWLHRSLVVLERAKSIPYDEELYTSKIYGGLCKQFRESKLQIILKEILTDRIPGVNWNILPCRVDTEKTQREFERFVGTVGNNKDNQPLSPRPMYTSTDSAKKSKIKMKDQNSGYSNPILSLDPTRRATTTPGKTTFINPLIDKNVDGLKQETTTKKVEIRKSTLGYPIPQGNPVERSLFSSKFSPVAPHLKFNFQPLGTKSSIASDGIRYIIIFNIYLSIFKYN